MGVGVHPARFHDGNAKPHLFGDSIGDLRFDAEQVVELVIVRFGPHVRLVRRPNQLRGDAQAPLAFADAAFEHVVDAQFLPDLPDAPVGALVAHDRSSSDHAEIADAAEPGDQLFGEPVAQELARGSPVRFANGRIAILTR